MVMKKKHIKHEFSLFFLCLTMLLSEILSMTTNTSIPVNVGVILDYDKFVGKMGLSCINMALSDFYASHGYYKTRLHLNSRDSMGDVIGAAAAALDLIKNVKVQAIIGPLTSTQANFIIHLGDKAQVPVISFSASSPSLTSLRSSYFFRVTQNASSQVKAITAIIHAFGWREVVPIYEDNEHGDGIIPFLTDALQHVNARVAYRSVIHPLATDDQIGLELYKLKTMETRVFIVHMLPDLGYQVFTKAKEIGMMSEGYVWIMTDVPTSVLTSKDPSLLDSMQGVLGVNTYVPKTKKLENFRTRWKRKFQQDNATDTFVHAKLNVFGLWAYDATWALAMAVEKAGTTNFGFEKKNASGNSSTDLGTILVSRNGPKLRETLLTTTFRGLTGEFSFISGQLQSSPYQIINVNGDGQKVVAFWTPEDGLVRDLNSPKTGTYSTSKASFRPIIWPGDSTSVPKGWEIPTNGMKLKIGVPVKDGFKEFVKVTHDHNTNTTSVTGYCIDVFKAVMEALPYYVPYEFIPFENSNGEQPGSYNDLVDQVYLGNFDAVVGDVTIIANRSLYVDFTLPYTGSGVSMVVRIQDIRRKNAWVFLKPLTWDLWMTTGCFFVFIGFVVWVLEHRINEDFRGPPSHQIGTGLWFSFSTMVFAHRERVESNLARFVVIIWVFVVLILTQSYTASLTSLLTVQQLQPAVTDVHELLKKGENVGFLDGSFVSGILKQLGFNESKLKIYGSPEECDELFDKGSANGGIAAAFDEVPYMNLFLAKYCSKYIMIEPTFTTDGFGFVFPKGSPLVADISRAILNVTEGDKMKIIESAYFEDKINCPEPSSTLFSSASLGLESFWGLFLIAGVASSSALIIYWNIFLYKHRHMMHFDPKASISKKFHVILRFFDQKDLSSHTFKKSELRDRSGTDSTHGMGAVEASPNPNYPPSPSSCSTHTDSDFSFFGEQGTPSAEHGNSNSNGQASQEIEPAIELTLRNQDT